MDNEHNENEWNVKNSIESKKLLEDLNLILSHLSNNGGKFLNMIKSRKKDKNGNIKNGFIQAHNLNEYELMGVFIGIIKLINYSTKKDICSCEKCKEAKQALKIILETYTKLEIINNEEDKINGNQTH